MVEVMNLILIAIVFEIPNEYSIHHEIRKTNNNTYFFIDAEIEYHPCPIECDDSFSFPCSLARR